MSTMTRNGRSFTEAASQPDFPNLAARRGTTYLASVVTGEAHPTAPAFEFTSDAVDWAKLNGLKDYSPII